ncbi:hypothetical protein [Paraburkholderia sp.]
MNLVSSLAWIESSSGFAGFAKKWNFLIDASILGVDGIRLSIAFAQPAA